MRLYVANCTHQVHDFIYRLPENPAAMRQQINIGGQIMVAGDLNSLQVDAVVNQHRRYGLVNVTEIDRTKNFIGVCYSLDKPVQIEKIRVALKHNNEVLTERGRKLRQEAALAVSQAMEDVAPGLSSLEMSVVEEPKDGNTPTFAEGTRVTRTAPDGSPLPQTGPEARPRAPRRRTPV